MDGSNMGPLGSPTTVLRIKHLASGIELHFQRDRRDFYCDGQVHYFSSRNLSNVVGAIIELHPQPAHSELLKNELRAAVNDRASNAVHRGMNNIKTAIIEVLGSKAPYPFVSLRNEGYVLTSAWKKVDQAGVISALVDDHVATIKNIVNRSKAHLHRLKVMTNAAGLTSVTADSEFAWRNFHELTDSGRAIMNSIATPKNYADVKAIKDSIFTLLSYVTFFRIGDKLSEVQWKEDYYFEIDRLLKKLDMEIALARSGDATS